MNNAKEDSDAIEPRTNKVEEEGTTDNIELTSPVIEKALPENPHHITDQEIPLCGWWFCYPHCLQLFRTAKWALFGLCWAGTIQGMVVSGFVNVDITTIERRFGLRSSHTGLIAGGYDIASLLCLVPVTYFGGRTGASKPRWLGYGVLIMGIGSFIFAIPHFAIGIYRGNADLTRVCVQGGMEPLQNNRRIVEHLTNYRWVFFLGQFLHGIGTSPLYTLGVTYIDENVSTKMSSVYLGIFYTMAISGTAIGYVFGGQLLVIFTDTLSVDPDDFGLTTKSQAWIGAWWIGFLVTSVLCLCLSMMLIAFPPVLPGAAELRAQKISEAHQSRMDVSVDGSYGQLPDLPRATLKLLRNPTFFCLNLAAASEGFIASGFCAFLPKFLENQFAISPTKAALLMGIITVPAGGGGTFLGGYLVKRYQLHCSGILKFCLASSLIGAVFTTCFLISCPNQIFAGITTPYKYSTSIHLNDTCNTDCSCSKTLYDPICGMDDIMYYSPCYAGCTLEFVESNTRYYRNCACIKNASTIICASQSNIPLDSLLVSQRQSPFYEARGEKCESSCNNLLPFIILIFGIMFFTFICSMPALAATLRCVHHGQRSFALGIQWMKVRLLGTIPAPLLFGALIDKSCIQWQGENGACLVFDNAYMSYYMMMLAFVGKAVGVCCFFMAWTCYKPPYRIVVNEKGYVEDKVNLLNDGDGNTTTYGSTH